MTRSGALIEASERVTTATVSEPIGLKIYRAASWASGPVAEMLLRQRLREGKEDPARMRERTGLAGRARPAGELCWIHGASVGESLSVLPLVERFTRDNPSLNILVTTGTVTSAKLMSERLPKGAIHQFIPVDHPRFVRGFLDHWRPDTAIFVESEFWPNLLIETRQRAKRMALVNGRVSPKSYSEWKGKPQSIRFLLSHFDLLIAQDHQNAERLTALSGRDVVSYGNLKNAAPPLPGDVREEARLLAVLDGRPFWLAASTHPGEEEAIFAAHKALKTEHPDLVTFLAPRHPERGQEVADLAAAAGVVAKRRSKGEAIDRNTDFYIADTLGELGIFYRVANATFVGGSLVEKGGHNPLEPARLGCAILHGPHIFNFVETYADIRGAGGAALVRNDRDLAVALKRLFADDKTRQAMADTARNAAKASAERVLSDVVGALNRKFAAQ
ncbi:MAG: 3-deoxy-D-manno-octulosonic acid transferase [Parvularculaceae bacterium]|nr:3-deoxy-D-manno-octulosonic acid transferase [Parvularculaceae bacterium]